MPKVIIWRDGAIENEFDPGHRDWRIGRSETNDITLLDPRKSVSRFHAELREEQGRWVFIDLNSQNGSWKDGQRVNRLVLENGHEVLFGDYKLAFVDVPAPPPPPPPAPAAGGFETTPVERTADVPIAPDQTLLMPGAKSGGTPVPAAGPPVPVKRQATKPKGPRQGVNPVILVLFVLAMLGAVAAVAYRLVTDSEPVEPPVAETVPAETPAASVPAASKVEAPGSGQGEAPTGVATTDAQAPGANAPGANAPGANGSGANGPGAGTAAPPPAVATSVAAAVSSSTPPAPPATGRRTGAARPRRAPVSTPAEPPAVVARYDEGRRALSAGRYADAQRAFEAVLAQQPNFRDTAARLEEARAEQAAARERSIAEAQSLEAKGEWTAAIAAYERAGAGNQAAGARTKMATAGDDAYRRARQFDARNRPADAIPLYQRAVEWLPDSDARKATAQERLAALTGGGA